MQQRDMFWKEKQKDAKGKLQSDIQCTFANLVSKEYFSIQCLIIFLLYE